MSVPQPYGFGDFRANPRLVLASCSQSYLHMGDNTKDLDQKIDRAAEKLKETIDRVADKIEETRERREERRDQAADKARDLGERAADTSLGTSWVQHAPAVTIHNDGGTQIVSSEWGP